MPEQCGSRDIDEVKAILEAVNQLNQEEKRDELIGKIKRCASRTRLSREDLTSSLGKISGISEEEIEQIVRQTPPPIPPPPGGPPPGASLESGSSGSPTTEEVNVTVGGKRKSKKNKSKKSKSKKRRSKDVSIER